MAAPEDPSPSPFIIAIVGGGIARVTLAISLLRRDITAHIYERGVDFVGIGLGANAVRAMSICDPGLRQAFDRVATSGVKNRMWFDWVDGFNKSEDGKERFLFNIDKMPGANGCHRTHFMNECDGIRSRVRQLALGEDNSEAFARYSHVYAYRGLVPMEKAVEALGYDTAMTRMIHMGVNGHILTYPVANSALLNVPAFKYDEGEWPHGSDRISVPADPEKVLADFADFSPAMVKISGLLIQDKKLDCWGIFDTFENPLSTFAKGRICVAGDTAHASAPHFGAGAGMGVEDSAVMAEVLAEARQHIVKAQQDKTAGPETVAKTLAAAFATFDSCRCERTQWLVRVSRDAGDIYQWRFPASGRDAQRCKEELESRARVIWDVDVEGLVEEAKADFGKRLGE